MKRLAIFLTVVMILAGLTALSGCARRGQERTPEPATSVTISEEPIETPQGNATVNSETEVVEPAGPTDATLPPESGETAPIETTEPVIEEDPIGMLEVTEKFAKETNGVYLRRNGKLYSLGIFVPRETCEKYNVGWRRGANYMYGELSVICGETNRYVTAGDVAAPVITEGDEIISYGFTGFNLDYVEKVGYSIMITENTPYKKLWVFTSLVGGPLEIGEYTAPSLEVRDAQGNLMSDYHDLEYMETYTVSWIKGTEYNEIQMIANCRSYETKGTAYSFTGTVGKNGYATYEFTGVEPGTYKVRTLGGNVGFIVVQ